MDTLNTIASIEVLPESGNYDFIQLLNDGEPALLKSVDKIVIILDDCAKIDSSVDPGVISWATYEPLGVVRLRLGKYSGWSSGTRLYQAKVVVYDPFYIKGILWGSLRIRVLMQCST